MGDIPPALPKTSTSAFKIHPRLGPWVIRPQPYSRCQHINTEPHDLFSSTSRARYNIVVKWDLDKFLNVIPDKVSIPFYDSFNKSSLLEWILIPQNWA